MRIDLVTGFQLENMERQLFIQNSHADLRGDINFFYLV